MCKIVAEGVLFPFPEMEGAPRVAGALTIHRDGRWRFHVVDGEAALTYYVVAGAVEISYDGEVPEGETRYFTGEYPRMEVVNGKKF